MDTKLQKIGPHLECPADLTDFPDFPPNTTSLLSTCLTREIFEKLRGKKVNGFSFEETIFSGCKFPESSVGVYAGCHESYKAFAPLFDPIIEKYHGHGANDLHAADMDFSKLDFPRLAADEEAMIVSTRVRIARNLAGFPLGAAISAEERREVESRVVAVLEALTGELAGKYFSLEKMTDSERKQLIADHFLFKGGDKFLASSGLERDWPQARGIFHNVDKTFLVWLNEEDQLRIISMQKGFDLGQILHRLSVASQKIEKAAEFAFDDHLGYITSCPTNLGTGIRASVHIKLPKLGEKKILQRSIAEKYQLDIRGKNGEHCSQCDVFDISNARRLGQSEVELVKNMYEGVRAMIAAEKSIGT